MLIQIKDKKYFYLLICIGFALMAVAGSLLYVGLAYISASEAIYIIISIAFLLQVVESFCFLSAFRYSDHSLLFKYVLLLFGGGIFLSSIIILTIAQYAVMQPGKSLEIAANNRVAALHDKIVRNNSLILSYRVNADNQSKSKYIASRRLGGLSLDKAAILERENSILISDIYDLESSGVETTTSTFDMFGGIIGVDSGLFEMLFYMMRSLFLELGGILFLSFGASGLRNIASSPTVLKPPTPNFIDPYIVPLEDIAITPAIKIPKKLPKKNVHTLSKPNELRVIARQSVIDYENGDLKYMSINCIRTKYGIGSVKASKVQALVKKISNNTDGSL